MGNGTLADQSIVAVLISAQTDTEAAEILTGLGVKVPGRVCRLHYWLVEDVARVKRRLGM